MSQALPTFTLEPSFPVRILAVDDDPQILKMLEITINSFGYQCSTAVDGMDALEKLANGGFSLVLTDLTIKRNTRNPVFGLTTSCHYCAITCSTRSFSSCFFRLRAQQNNLYF